LHVATLTPYGRTGSFWLFGTGQRRPTAQKSRRIEISLVWGFRRKGTMAFAQSRVVSPGAGSFSVFYGSEQRIRHSVSLVENVGGTTSNTNYNRNDFHESCM